MSHQSCEGKHGSQLTTWTIKMQDYLWVTVLSGFQKTLGSWAQGHKGNVYNIQAALWGQLISEAAERHESKKGGE